MSTRTHDTDDDAIERQLGSIFDSIGTAFGEPANEIADARRIAARRTIKRRRMRIAIGLGLVAALGTGGAAQYAAMKNNEVGKPVDVRMSEPGREGVLVPTMSLSDKGIWFSPIDPSVQPVFRTRVWGDNNTRIWLRSFKVTPEMQMKAADVHQEDLYQEEAGSRFLNWTDGERSVSLQSTGALSKESFLSLRADVRFDANGDATIPVSPLGLPLLLDTTEPEFIDQWYVKLRLSGSLERRCT